MYQVYNDEIKHYGVIGMKWRKHKNNVKAKKKRQIANDKNILSAREKSSHLLKEYNNKVDIANSDINNKKTLQDVNNAYTKLMNNSYLASQRTHRERNVARTKAALTVIGGLTVTALAPAFV